MKYRNSLLSGAFCTGLLVLSACGAPQQIAYFQDFNQNPDTLINLKSAVITAKPTDKLYIGVKSRDPQISQLFNLTGTATTSTVAKDAYYYTVDSKGNIDFPVLGTVHVANLSREQVAEKIKKALIDASLVKDPVVTVGLSNLHYSVMGEVNHPGQFAIEDEKVTILDAISNAGDLTITGAVRSKAVDIESVITEISAATVSERGETRADDRTSVAAMEDRKREGYF